MTMIRILVIGLLLSSQWMYAQTSALRNKRSDTIDVLHYEVNLDITDFTTKVVKGNTKVLFSPKVASVGTISLDLLKFTIDSVKHNGSLLTYTYNDTLLISQFGSAIVDTDTTTIEVYYHGVPQEDPAWGGFYFQSGYAYNLGVGFVSNPHNFGRVWHACFDNFVEHATYEINLTTTGGKVGYSNGVLVSEVVAGPNVIRKWIMNDPIPSYLACLAVNNYTHVDQTYVSALTGLSTPIMLISLPADTTNFKSSFINLPNAVNTYEQQYGAFEWDKIGYVAVPFSSGAMEHASCIAYPRATLTGATTYQTLMAHELSHHWWGDLVTCQTAEDMWINEGMARWSEALFLEHLSGYSAYLTEIRSNHKNVVWKAHVNDGGFWPISGVPENVTYGTTTYDKGADVVHTMRGYLGDTLFYAGLKSIIANNKFKNIDAAGFRDQMNLIPGIDLTNFFNDWVFQPGFPEFAVDSMLVSPAGSLYDVTVYSKQKWRGGTHLATNVPLQITFMDHNFNSFKAQATLSGANQSFTVNGLPFIPSAVFYNENEKISEAVTAQQTYITSTGAKNLSNANFILNVQSVTDSVFARAELHWVAADNFSPANFLYNISPDRFWRLHLLGDVDGMYSKATIQYNGTTTSGGYLDNGLMALLPPGAFNEDSLRVFYRKDATENWSVYPYATFTFGSKTDKVGSISLDSIKAGDYALGIKTSAISVPEFSKNEKFFKVFPNPTADEFKVVIKTAQYLKRDLILTTVDGTILETRPVFGLESKFDMRPYSSGTYLLHLTDQGKVVQTQKIIVAK